MDLYTEAELYCAAFDWPVDAEVDWVLSHVPHAKSVLEPMCGNARYGPVFVERGLTFDCAGTPGNAASHDDEHVHGWAIRLGQDVEKWRGYRRPEQQKGEVQDG